MKKVISLVLAIALFAALSVVAFAEVETHYDGYCHPYFGEMWVEQEDGSWKVVEDGVWPWMNDGTPITKDQFEAAVRESSDHVDVTMPAGMELRWTKHSEAITATDLEAFTDYKNLTVFYQRMVKTNAAGEMTVKLWDCCVAKDQQVVVLAHDATNGWTDLAPNCGDKTVTVTVPDGMDSFVVCLAY